MSELNQETNAGERSKIARVACKGVWKLFGDRADEALEAARAENLSKDEIRERFDCVLGVRDASFEVYEGEIFCIMGLSGSGKSTLVRHINRLIDPTAGEIHVAGDRVDTMDEASLNALRSEKIGMVFQHMALWPHRTLAETVAFGLEVRGVPKAERRKRAIAALSDMELGDWVDSYPDELSGGMQQRVGLARALAADPDILLMDEPFSALDPLIRRQLQDQFLDLSRKLGKTTIFITHDLDEAIRMGDRIAIMKDGVIVQTGTAEEIVTAPANDYVAAFVENVPKGGFVTASQIMEPVDGTKLDRSIEPGMPLDDILATFAEDQTPLAVEQDGDTLGRVTVGDALQALGGKEGS